MWWDAKSQYAFEAILLKIGTLYNPMFGDITPAMSLTLLAIFSLQFLHTFPPKTNPITTTYTFNWVSERRSIWSECLIFAEIGYNFNSKSNAKLASLNATHIKNLIGHKYQQFNFVINTNFAKQAVCSVSIISYNSIKLLTKNTTDTLFSFYAETMQHRPQHPIIIFYSCHSTKISTPYKWSGKTKFSMASCILICSVSSCKAKITTIF